MLSSLLAILISLIECVFSPVTMVGCAAPKCKSRAGRYRKSFHRFPSESDPERRKKWVKAIKRAASDGFTLWKPTLESRLCEVGHCVKTYKGTPVSLIGF